MRLLKMAVAALLLCACGGQPKNEIQKMDEKTVERGIEAAAAHSSLPHELVVRGVTQVASLWRASDGSEQDFVEFCEQNICADAQERSRLFERCCDNFEAIYGAGTRLTQDLQRPVQLVGYTTTAVDGAFAAYSPTAHLSDDLFANKVAFVVALNFPFCPLDEKNAAAGSWTPQEWGYARLGDLFTDRVPAQVQQQIGTVMTEAEDYISNYNIHMQCIVDEQGKPLFPAIKLLTHWGLRDEIKSNYAAGEAGLKKQQAIYAIMKRIIDQSIPTQVIDNDTYRWNPQDNSLAKEGTSVTPTPEGGERYRVLLRNFRAIKESDAYYTAYPNYIDRHFDGQLEISAADAEALFTTLCSSPLAAQVGKIIESRLGRPLQPYDIWYDGFKSRSNIDPEALDAEVRAKYPTREAFAADLPAILMKLGFAPEKARFIADHVTVEASVGSGHAWQSSTRRENALLRTRVSANGMDYKGYNIGVHEFGHNVEQVISLFDVDNYFLAGIPNDAFTEALAFVLQYKDMQLLGHPADDAAAQDLMTLNFFWDCYEVMGVALLDIETWRWMYAHPDATAAQLQEAVIGLAKELWNRYYAPVFGSSDEPILAIYSHAIELALYLPSYPIGHVIEFQLDEYFRDKNIGTEVCRIYSQGRLTPQEWMRRAVGASLSAEPLLKATQEVLQRMLQK